MQLTTQVLARNVKGQVVVLSSDPKGSETVEWAAAGDPSGNDLQVVSENIANSVAFIRLVAKGVVVVDPDSNSADIVELFARQKTAFDQRNQSAAQAVQASIDVRGNNDMITLPCIGPDARGGVNGGVCAEPVPVRELTKFDKPALCPMHVVLAPQYVQGETSTPGVGSGSVKVWTRATTGARETQQA